MSAGRISRRALLGTAGVAGLALAGCVKVPTSGPVQEVVPSRRASEPRGVQVQVRPPSPGASPRVVLSGFLLAMVDYQPNYEIARKFLTSDVRDDWRPENGVDIVDDNYVPTSGDGSAVVSGVLVGRLGPGGSFREASGALTIDLGLVRDKDGEWRISKPPNGLLITQSDFERTYRPLNLYFLEPGLGSLVPDPIYLPQGNFTASTMMQRLLAGPSDWLRPAVATAFPDKTAALSVPVDDAGVVEVGLNDGAAGLNDDRRTLLAAQTVWTLRQLDGVTGVRFNVSGAPYQIGRSAPGAAIPVTSMDSYGPVAPQISTQLFVASAAGLLRLDDSGGRRDALAVPGPLGVLAGIQSVGVTPAGDRAAVVVKDKRGIRVGEFGDREPATLLPELAGLRQPQYTRFGELLVLQRPTATESVLWQVRDGAPQRVEVDLPAGTVLSSLRVAPDGMRAAVVVTDARGSHFGLMLVTRNGGLRLSAYREVTLTLAQGTPLTRISQAAWTSATSLAMLASDSADSPLRVYQVSQDGTDLEALGTPDDWQAATLVACQGRQSGSQTIAAKLAMLGAQGTVRRYDGSLSWSVMALDLTAVAYPG